MTYSFNDNMTLAMQHELRVRELIGRSTILPANLTVDKTMGKDLLVFSDATGHGVAARVRRHGDYPKYDFTIRSSATGNGVTELEKFKAGMCKMMFYGVLNESESDFDRWMLFSLDAWREAMARRERGGGFHLHYDGFRNSDGSRFLVCSAASTRLIRQPKFMIDCSDDDYPGPVLMRHYRRKNRDVHRFRRSLA